MFNFSELMLIVVLTIVPAYIVCRKEKRTTRIIFVIISASTFLYSGVGIAYETVDSKYIVQYVLFLVSILVTVKLIFHVRVKRRFNIDTEIGTIDFDCNSKMVTILTVVFFISISMHLFYPTFQPWKFFQPSGPISTYIYAQRANSRSYLLLNICETLSTACLPFFCMYLKRLVEKHKKLIAVLLVALWAYLTYLQYNYIGRYQLIVYAAFAYFICAFVRPEGIVVQRKYIIIFASAMIAMIPFLVAYTSIRKGIISGYSSISDSISTLIEEECGYPLFYNVCEGLQGTGGRLNFILWMVLLPIPSAFFIFTSKPTLAVAHQFTYAITGRIFGTGNYSSSLPSVLGEGIMIWGMNWVWLHGIVMGIFIGINLRFLKGHRSLDILYLYMITLLTVIGRGGAQSYMGTLINGTVFIMLWWWACNRVRIGSRSLRTELRKNNEASRI